MAAVAPPPPMERQSKPSSSAKGPLQRLFDFSNARHALKLRQSFKASDKLRIEIGMNIDMKTKEPSPWAGARMLLDGTKEESWAIEVNTDRALLCTPRVDLASFTDRFDLPIDARVGRDFLKDGTSKPHFEFGLHNPYAAGALLVVALVAQLPVHIRRRETGGLAFDMPIKVGEDKTVPHTGQARAEIDATIDRKEGFDIQVKVRELNAVLRLRQDD